MKRTFLRVVSAFLAVVMMVGANMTTVFAATDVPAAAKVENNVIYTTDAQIVADYYDFLSAAEKAVLTCTALVANDHTITVPTDENKDELIIIDKENKTVTVKPFVKGGYTWVPAVEIVPGTEDTENPENQEYAQLAKVKYGANEIAYVKLVADNGVYTGDFKSVAADSYTIDVTYALEVEIAVDEQKKLANAPAYLANGIVNLDMILNSVDAQLETLTDGAEVKEDVEKEGKKSVVGELYGLVEGITVTIGGYSFPIGFSEGTDEYNATVDLYNDCNENGGRFGINVLMDEYREADNKVEYLIKNGDKVKAAFNRVHNNIAVLGRDGSRLEVLSNQADGYAEQGFLNMATASALKLVVSVLKSINGVMSNVPAGDWAVLDLDYELVKDFNSLANAEKSALDAAVKALASGGSVALNDAETYSASLEVATNTVQQGVDQYKVTVVVNANVVGGVDSDKLTTLISSESIAPIFDHGTLTSDIEAAIYADGVIVRAIEAWANNAMTKGYNIDYRTNNYSVKFDFDKLESNELDRVTTCTVTLVPKNCEVTLGYGDTMTVPYGYKYTLPKYPDGSKSYDYTVGGEAELEGVVYTVVGDVEITRVEGKTIEGVRIPTIVANSNIPGAALSDEAKAVLYSAAIVGENLYYRTPGEDTPLVTVESVSGSKYSVSALSLASSPKTSAKWVPVGGYAVDSSGKEINGTSLTFDSNGKAQLDCAGGFAKVAVIYQLEITDVELSLVNDYANLPYNLVAEAKAQKELLDPLVSGEIYANFAQVNGVAGAITSMVSTGMGFGTPAVEAAARLNQICVNSSTTPPSLYLVSYLEQYKAGGLAWLYSGTNAVMLSQQIINVAKELKIIVADPAFIGTLNTAGFGAYATKIDVVLEKLDYAVAAIENDVLVVNPYIDRNSDYLSGLVSAIEAADGKVAKVTADKLTLQTILSEDAPGATSVTVNIHTVYGNGNTVDGSAKSESVSFAIGATLSENDIKYIESVIDALNANVTIPGGIDKSFYNCEITGMPKAGDAINGKVTVSVVWSPKKYTVKIDGEADTVLTSDSNLKVVLPACSDTKYKYVYTVGTKTYEVFAEAGEAQLTLDDLNKLFDNGVLVITREPVEISRDTIIKFVTEMNAALATANMPISFVLVENENSSSKLAVVLRVTASVAGADMGGIMSVAEALLPYTYIGLGGKAFYNGTVSVQAVIDMIANSDFGFDTLCEAIDKNGNVVNMSLDGYTVIGGSGALGAKLIESSFELNGEENSYPLYVTLGGGDPATLLGIKDALTSIRPYADFKCADGKFNIAVNAPDYVYPFYLAEMLVLGKADLADVKSMDLADCIKYEMSLIKPVITDDQFSIKTVENTLAKLGKPMDLSGYASTFNTVVNVANYLFENVIVEAESNGSVYHGNASCNIRNGLISLDLPEMIVGMIAEASENSLGISADFAITLENMDAEYEAMILDYSAAGLKNKFYCTTDLASALEKLNENAVVVLLSDVELGRAVTISKNAFINLNGFDIVGDIKSNASVRIVDSKIGTADAGVVEGKLTGSFVITGGKYTSDVSSMLKKGYSVNENGYVCNDLYSLKQDKNDIEIVLSADVLTADIPDLKAFLMDVVADIALNLYTSAAVTVDGNSIYSVEFDDVVGMLKNTSTELANMAIDVIDLDGVNYIVDTLIASLCDDLGALATAIRTGAAVAEYNYEANGWAVETFVADGNYVTASLLPGGNVTNGKIVVKVGAEGEDTTALADLCENLSEILVIENVDFNINSVEYVGGTGLGLNVEYDATVNATLNLSENNDYAALIATAVAYKLPAGAQKTAMVEALDKYFDTAETVALLKALESATAAQVISAVKALGGVECADMLTALGLSSESVVKLEAVYADLIDVAAAVLNKFDITGPAATIKAIKVDGSFASYNFTKENVKNYNVDVDLTLNLMSEVQPAEEVKIEVIAPDITDDAVTDLVRGFEYVDTKNIAFVDAICDGVTVEQLLSVINFNISNADTQRVYVVDATGNELAKDALVGTGCSLVVEASNASGSEKLTALIIIVGDTNGSGFIDADDASRMTRHYLDIAYLDEVMILAADVNKNGELDADDAARNTSKYLYAWENGSYESFYNNK